MDPQERARHLRRLPTTRPADNAVCVRQLAKESTKLIKRIRRSLERVEKMFQRIEGATIADKQTAIFDTMTAETDGSLLLHDLAIIFDCLGPVANDNRQPDEDILIMPFTEADVDAYEA